MDYLRKECTMSKKKVENTSNHIKISYVIL